MDGGPPGAGSSGAKPPRAGCSGAAGMSSCGNLRRLLLMPMLCQLTTQSSHAVPKEREENLSEGGIEPCLYVVCYSTLLLLEPFQTSGGSALFLTNVAIALSLSWLRFDNDLVESFASAWYSVVRALLLPDMASPGWRVDLGQLAWLRKGENHLGIVLPVS